MPERDSSGQPSAEEQLRALYDNAESATTRAFEQAVSSPTFGALLARSAENVAALSRIGSDLADLVLRNLRVAGRSDITRLARQLHRTEDKLERVLQEIEQLRDELADAQAKTAQAPARRQAAARATTANGRGNGESPRAGRRTGSGSTGPRTGSGSTGPPTGSGSTGSRSQPT